MENTTWSDVAESIAKARQRDKKIEALGYTQVLNMLVGYFQWVKNSDIIGRENGYIVVAKDATYYDDIEV